MVWPERGAGLSPLVAGCDHWISPMDFAGADMGSERRRRYVSATAIRALLQQVFRYLVIQKRGKHDKIRDKIRLYLSISKQDKISRRVTRSACEKEGLNQLRRTNERRLNSTKRGASTVMCNDVNKS